MGQRLGVGSEIGYGFRRNYGSSFQFQMNKEEIEICEFKMHLKF